MADTQLIGIPIEDLQEADSSNLTDSTKVIVEDDGTPVTRQCNLGVMGDWVNDRVVIGGRNLIPNTKDMSGYTGASNVTFETDNEGFTVATWSAVNTLAWNQLYVFEPIQFSEVRGKTVTVSLFMRSEQWEAINTDDTAYLQLAFCLCKANSTARTLYRVIAFKNVVLFDGWVKVFATITLSDDFFTQGTGTIDDTTRFFITFYNYTLYSMQIKKPKLELGNKATDWCLSDKDLVEATTEKSGLMSADDKTDLEAIKVATAGLVDIQCGKEVLNWTTEVQSKTITFPRKMNGTNTPVIVITIGGGSYWLDKLKATAATSNQEGFTVNYVGTVATDAIDINWIAVGR